MKISGLGSLKKSLVWQLVLPVPIALVLGVGALSFFVPSAVEENARAAAIQAATQTVGQFKALRGYYTKSVIKKVLANGGVKPSFNHKSVGAGLDSLAGDRDSRHERTPRTGRHEGPAV
jgi:hypothetical protein